MSSDDADVTKHLAEIGVTTQLTLEPASTVARVAKILTLMRRAAAGLQQV